MKEVMPKFKIGNWVMAEGTGDKIKMRVCSILEETCSAGKQIVYSCRVYLKTGYDKDFYPVAPHSSGVEIRKYNEIELVPYKEEIKKEIKK